jgi:anti-sigma-K factor RskA
MNDIHALSGAYAVDALDGDERAQFEAHLAVCAACTEEVDSLREAAAVLAEVTATAPRPELRSQVLGAIGSVRPLPPTLEARRSRRRRTQALLAAAAAVVAIGAGGVVWSQVNDSGSTAGLVTASTELPDGSTMRVTRAGDGSGQLEATSMAAAPQGKQYVAWLVHGTTTTAIGALPDATDFTMSLGELGHGDGVAVSIEDAGRVPSTPSDDLVANVAFG